MKSGNLNFLEHSRPLQAWNGTALPLPFNLGKKSVILSSLCAEFEKHPLVSVKNNMYLIQST
jgi:hypothetical protein